MHNEAVYDSAEQQDGEWITPDEKAVIEGVIERAFLFKDTRDNFAVGYAVRDPSSKMVQLIGEKASFKNAIRALKIGTAIKLTFIEKVDITKNGKPTGHTFWRCNLESDRAGKGPTILEVLKADYEAQNNALPF